jgi:hypothetical protein
MPVVQAQILNEDEEANIQRALELYHQGLLEANEDADKESDSSKSTTTAEHQEEEETHDEENQRQDPTSAAAAAAGGEEVTTTTAQVTPKTWRTPGGIMISTRTLLVGLTAIVVVLMVILGVLLFRKEEDDLPPTDAPRPTPIPTLPTTTVSPTQSPMPPEADTEPPTPSEPPTLPVEPTIPPVEPTTVEPTTLAPTPPPSVYIIQDLPDVTLEALQNSSSAVSKAMQWLESYSAVETLDEWRKRQLLALATFFHALNGNQWPFSKRYGWLSDSVPECTWAQDDPPEFTQPKCNEVQEIQRLFLHQVPNLGNKQIPPEVVMLTNLQLLGLAHSNLTSPLDLLLPSSELLETLTRLEHLYFYENQIPGPIPTRLGALSALKTFHFQGNRLTGTIPSELFTGPMALVVG